jgi:hypothetical protein
MASVVVNTITAGFTDAFSIPWICCGLSATRPRTPPADSEAGDCSERGQHESFREELANQSTLSRPERRADGELAIAARRAHQQQAGDVGARDEQEHDDARLQDVERRTGVADQLVAQRDREPTEAARDRKRAALGQPFEIAVHDRGHLPVGLLDRGARPEPRNHLAELVAAALVRHLLRRERERLQHGDLGAGQLEVGPEHTCNAMRFAIQSDVASDNRRVGAKMRRPGSVSEDDEFVVAGLRLVVLEGASEKRLPAEGGEEGRRDRKRAQLFRLALRVEVDAPHREQGGVFERRRLFCDRYSPGSTPTPGIYQLAVFQTNTSRSAH